MNFKNYNRAVDAAYDALEALTPGSFAALSREEQDEAVALANRLLRDDDVEWSLMDLGWLMEEARRRAALDELAADDPPPGV